MCIGHPSAEFIAPTVRKATNTSRKIHGETGTDGAIAANVIASGNFYTIGGFAMLARSETKIAYQIETLAECLADAKALFPDHWAEIGSNKEVRQYNPDLDLRCLLEEKNRLVVATARDFGRLIGYIDWIIFHDPQCKDQLTAETDIYFVEERPNRALVMLSLIRESLAALRQRGVLIARPRTKLKKDGPGRGAGLLWQRLGFKPLEIIYSRNLLTDAPKRS